MHYAHRLSLTAKPLATIMRQPQRSQSDATTTKDGRAAADHPKLIKPQSLIKSYR